MSNKIVVELVNSWQGARGGDGAIAHAAWASSTDFSKLSSKSDEDIRRTVTNVVDLHHDTPKERVWLEFFLTVPIWVERQLDKYRMTVQYQDFVVEFLERPMGGDHITQNELSARYRTLPDRSYGLPEDVEKILQTAAATEHARGWAKSDSGTFAVEMQQLLDQQYAYFKTKLTALKSAEQKGVITNAQYKRAREVLRGALGTAFMTDMRIVMNLNAFEHILNQRLAKDAAVETRIAAYLMFYAALNGSVAPTVIGRFCVANNWQPLLDDIATYLPSRDK